MTAFGSNSNNKFRASFSKGKTTASSDTFASSINSSPGRINDIESLVLYEDKDVVVCHKPAGVLSQSDRGFSQDMVSALTAREKKKGAENVFIAPVNRLDRPVEGIILFAKSSEAAASMTKKLVSSELSKFYYAVIDNGGMLKKGDSAELENYLVKDSGTNTSRIADANTAGAKLARLRYEVVGVKGNYALVSVELFTGRHHQIRVQLAGNGHAIIGDTKYNASARMHFQDMKSSGGWQELALCSYRLVFPLPFTGELKEITTKPQGKIFSQFIDVLQA